MRVYLVVAAIAVAAAGLVVGVTLATRQTPVQPQAQPGSPPLPKVLPTPAAGRIRTAFRAWPHGSVDAMVQLGREYPRDPVVQFYLGLALVWAGYENDAVAPLRAAKRVGRDTLWAVQADSLLHPQFYPGYPPFVSAFAEPELRHRFPLLVRGIELQRRGHQQSAEQVFRQAARQRPDDAEAQVAAAVALFDKDDLSRAFSQLGPLVKRFPHSQSVPFNLGLMLVWTGQRDPAIAQFRRTLALGRTTALGRDANAFLSRIEQAGTAPTGK